MDASNLAGQKFGQYTLIEQIGEGGMSAVYRGYQSNLKRAVAVKVMAPALMNDPSYRERFESEARTAALLEHNNIVPVYDYGTEGSNSYIVMRLLTGGSLGQRLKYRINNNLPLPTLSEGLTLAKEMSKALGYAHGEGIIHRDIKPNNIMFDSQGDPYLVDFGIAHAIHANTSLTAENITIGTPPYMAPEQWRDEILTPAVDQYAFGVLMYYVFTGKLPFEGRTAAALMNQHLHEAPLPAHTIRPELPTAASSAIDRAMAKKPDDRFATIEGFAQALEAALSVETSTSSDFFTFPLPGTEETPPPAPPEDAKTTPASVSAAPTTIQAPTVEPPPPPQSTPPAPPQAPPNTPPRRPAPRRKTSPMMQFLLGTSIGIGLLVLIIVVTGVVAWQFLRPTPPTNNTAPTAEVTEEVAIAPTIRINATSAPPTAITVVGPGDGEQNISISGEVILHEELNIVVRAIAISPSGVVFSGHADGTVRMWANGTGAEPQRMEVHTSVINDMDISQNGTVMVSGGDDRTLRVWDATTGTYRGLLSVQDSAVRGVAVNRDGTRAAVATEGGSVVLFDVDAGTVLATLRTGSPRAFDVAFSPDGQWLAAGIEDGTIPIYSVSAQSLSRTLRGHNESVRSVAFSPDGAQLASSSTDDTVRLWDFASGTTTATFSGHGRDVWRVIFNPAGTLLASGGRDNTARLWEITNGTELSVIRGHAGWVLGLAFSPDGSVLATASGDGSVRLWNVE